MTQLLADWGGKVTVDRCCMLDINCPELFKDEEFLDWLNDVEERKFTWHSAGQEADEWSDVMVTYDNGEGSNCDMPEHAWELITHAWEENCHPYTSGFVRLLNYA